MKKLYCLTIILIVSLSFTRCNDEWNDELYENLVSLKAPINKDDVSIIYLRYKAEGKVTYKLPLIMSGSQTNKQELDILIGVDNDTLQDLNIAKFSYRSDLYYKQLPTSAYEFPSNTCHLKSGEDVSLFDVNFNFEGLDLVEKWVLPVTILPDPAYKLNTYKGRQKALLWVMPFNDYSGSYSATSLYVYFGDNTEKYMTASTREAKVVDDNTIFFYAGVTEELAENRGEYKVKCKFFDPLETKEIIDEKTGEGTGLFVKKGKLALSSDNPNIELEVVGEPSYEIKEELDIDRPHVIKRSFILTMEYKYKDYTSSSDMDFPYRCTGTLIMLRNINKLEPDEDQAILW